MSASLIERAIKIHGPEKVYAAIPEELRSRVRYEWRLFARPEQLPPDGDWLCWLLLAGRGFGKSRTGAEWTREQAKILPGSHGALIGPTAADVRDVMVKALLACTPPDEGLLYEPSKRLLSWKNGTTATLYSAEEPDRLRGPQHHWGWADEIAAWQYGEEVLDMFLMTLRLGHRPRWVASTTPRPIPLIRRLLKDKGTAVTRGSTFDNRANLSKTFVQAIEERYAGTRLGRQELFAEILDDVEGALWSHDMIDRARVKERPAEMRRIVVAVDPAGSAKKEADETGIVVAGVADCSCQGNPEPHGFVFRDLSGKYSPADMGRAAIAAYRDYGADRIVAEDNFGGRIIEDVIRLIDSSVSYRSVHASRGKIVRAEPVAALYERGKIHHVGMHAKLEDELCTYTPHDPKSPGRMDALVWAMTDLLLGEPTASFGDTEWKAPRRQF